MNNKSLLTPADEIAHLENILCNENLAEAEISINILRINNQHRMSEKNEDYTD
jgi:hypothetical protein